MWPIILSDRLRVVGLVGRYPTNYLIRREPLYERSLAGAFLSPPIEGKSVCGISPGFPGLSPTHRQVAHVLRTRSPLNQSRRTDPVRLACVKRAASVRPEPGSNSPLENSISSMNERLLSFIRNFVLTMSRFSALEDTMPPTGPRAGVPRGALVQALPLTRVVKSPQAADPLRHGVRTSFTRSAASARPRSSEPFNLTPPAPSVNPRSASVFSTSLRWCVGLTRSI